MLYSFDVFNTLIARRFDVFSVMQKILNSNSKYSYIDPYVRENFYWLRQQAVKLARGTFQKNGFEDVTLEEIYESFCAVGCSFSEVGQILANLERDTEIQSVCGISENIMRVKKLLSQGERVILISDMYLDSKSIRRMLTNVDKIFENIPLYVSSEYRKGKYTGNLYVEIKKIENVRFEEWKHFGDNGFSDVIIPQKYGIHSKKFEFTLLTNIEFETIKQREIDVEAQYIIGAARIGRMGKNFSRAALIGESASGPVIFAYVSWILHESERLNIHRLYFIARDGYIPKKVADYLIQFWGLKISTKYIYGSRKVWRFPAFDGTSKMFRLLIGMCYPERINSIEKLAKCMQVSKDDLYQFLPDWCQDKDAISLRELASCIEHLQQNRFFLQWLHEKAEMRRFLVKQYIKQETDLSDPNFAFVDLGGSGFTQSCLARILRDFCDFEIRTFFFKIDRMDLAAPSKFYTFIPGRLEHNLIIEPMYRATHGQTEDYKVKKGKITPVIRKNEGEELKAYGYDEYISGIMAFTESYAKVGKKISLGFVLQYMEYIMSYRDTELSDFFANMPNCENGILEDDSPCFAPKMTKRMIRDIYLFYPWNPSFLYYKGTDINLSLKRCLGADKKRIQMYKSKRNEIFSRFKKISYKNCFKVCEKQPNSDKNKFGFLGKIVIYGAGVRGQKDYNDAKLHGENIVEWIDQNYEQIKAVLPVTGTKEKLKTAFFDFIFISVADKKKIHEIKSSLLEMGIEENKIISEPWNQYRAKLYQTIVDSLRV